MNFGCKQDGSCQGMYIVGNYDGKRYKDSVNPNSEASFRRTDDRTMQQDGHSNGKLTFKSDWQLSPDGKTLTRIIHQIDPPAKDATLVYDRMGGPSSKDDAFAGFWMRNWNKGDALVVKYARKGDLLTFTDPLGVVHDRNCDGNDHAEKAPIVGDIYSCKFLEDGTYETASKRNGKVVSAITHKVSDDGKKMVWTVRNAEGKTFEYTYEKVE